MLAGVLCAVTVVIAQDHSASIDLECFFLGVSACVGSLLCASVNLVLAAVLGTNFKMNPVDTAGYMSIPASVLVIYPILFVTHPVDKNQWPPESFAPEATDWDILQVVLKLNPGVLGLVVVLGPLAFGYNVFTWRLIHTLTPTFTAAAGNFNKAATIALALLLGIDRIPGNWWGALNVAALVGNILAFTAYSALRDRNRRRAWVAAGDASQSHSEVGQLAEGDLSRWASVDFAEMVSFTNTVDFAECSFYSSGGGSEAARSPRLPPLIDMPTY